MAYHKLYASISSLASFSLCYKRVDNESSNFAERGSECPKGVRFTGFTGSEAGFNDNQL